MRGERERSQARVASGVAPNTAWPHGELYSITYGLELVLARGKGAGILYPPRNRSLTTGRPGGLCDGAPNPPTLAGEVTQYATRMSL